MAWSDRPKQDRYAIVGAFVGMIVAGIVAIMFASDTDTIVRYLIMAAGFLLGFGGGRFFGSRP